MENREWPIEYGVLFRPMRLFLFDAKARIITFHCSSLVIYARPCNYAQAPVDRKTAIRLSLLRRAYIWPNPILLLLDVADMMIKSTFDRVYPFSEVQLGVSGKKKKRPKSQHKAQLVPV